MAKQKRQKRAIAWFPRLYEWMKIVIVFAVATSWDMPGTADGRDCCSIYGDYHHYTVRRKIAFESAGATGPLFSGDRSSSVHRLRCLLLASPLFAFPYAAASGMREMSRCAGRRDDAPVASAFSERHAPPIAAALPLTS
jgi:hypothetical protein